MTTIYKHTCKITNKSYIGKTKRTIQVRLNEHIKQSEKIKKRYSHFEYAIRKYGIENFTSKIIVEDVPEYLSNPFEKYWIQYYNSIENGYNMTEGGDGASLTGKQNGMYGKKHSKETKLKLSRSCKELWTNDMKIQKSLKQSGKLNPMYNRTDQCFGLNKWSNNTKGKTLEEIHGLEKAKEIKKKTVRVGKQNGMYGKSAIKGKKFDKDSKCPYCNNMYSKLGLPNHIKKCKTN